MGRRKKQPQRADRREPTPAEQAIREAFGVRLRALRERGGMTQGEMAARCKLSKVFYGVVELGKKSASLETIGKLAAGLAISPAELLRFDAADSPDETPADKLGRQIASMASGTTPAQMRKILKLVKVYLEEEPEPETRKATKRR